MKLNDTEWRIMNVVWDQSPATVRQVFETLQDETQWSYSTVRTLMTRLIEKKALEAQRRGNTFFYQPLIKRDEARRSALKGLLDKAFEGTVGNLALFLASDEELSKKERQQLQKLIKDLDKE